MMKVRKMTALLLIAGLGGVVACEKDEVKTDTVENEVIEGAVEIRAEEEFEDQVNIDYFNSEDFQNQLDMIGWENLQEDGLNLEVVAYDHVIQTDPFDPSDIPDDSGIDPSQARWVKVIVNGDGPWGGVSLHPGVYFIDTDNGCMKAITGATVVGDC